MQRQLLARWRELHQDDDIGAVVLTGAGRAFCAGGDRSLFRQVGEGGPVRAELGRIHRELLRAFLTLPVATLAELAQVAR